MALINHIDENHDYKVSIPWKGVWTNIAAREQQWNDAAIWAMEHFGLPGDRYTCRPTKNNLEFWFLTEADALMFQIRWSS
jgi:hypothetical protein